MPRRQIPALLLFLALVLGPSTPAARTVLRFTGDEVRSRLPVPSKYIFQGSDSLFLNGRLLEVASEYEFLQGEGVFDLSRLLLSRGDTLVVEYDAVPAWMVGSYGREIPRVADTRVRPEVNPIERSSRATRLTGADIKLSGAKSFRFSARSSGGSEFGESLDLNISGDLSPGLTLTGSVSDRGYDPAYGTANSRLNELDKINLVLRSSRLTARIGDITIDRVKVESGPAKSVSGAAFDLGFSNWHINAAAARPRGVHSLNQFVGEDGFQGPYQVAGGGRARPIVPGSETVWLDGFRLERGAGKDYTVDYPTGRITFTVAHPIDSRSRIEIDFEPLATDYKEELFAAGGGVHLNDSVLFFSASAVREGDDRNQPLLGELSTEERDRLSAAGDTIAFRSGVTADSLGAYVLAVDSLPDSVYQYVGAGNGDLAVRFSFVGAGGSYRFAGSERHEYVGPENGDYAPIVILPAATRNDYYAATVGSHTSALGRLRLDVRTSDWDRNLWSSLDDEDNEALYYRLQAGRRWRWQGRDNSYRIFRRIREAGFRSRERIDGPDFRRQYLMPTGFLADADESLHEADLVVRPLRYLTISGALGVLDYERKFDSRSGEVGAKLSLSNRAILAASWRGISSHLDSLGLSGDGEGNNVTIRAECTPASLLKFTTEAERDSRQHGYTDLPGGTRFDRLQVSAETGTAGDGGGPTRVGSGLERVSWEFFVEDSLTESWNEVLRRNRVSGSSARRLGDLSYDAFMSYQWLERPEGDENSFLGRADVRYSSTRQRLTVNTAYTISEERRNARGITYLEVEPGLGDFVNEDGSFVPDPDGNYIEVEEILSDVARVRRAQKSFYLSRKWSLWQVRFDSEIEEELKDDGERGIWWALPFLSDADQPYLFFSRRYNGVVRVLPVQGFYAFNLLVSENTEIREISSSARRRRDAKCRLSLKQSVGGNFLEEGVELFRFDRDDYFSGSGDVEGYEVSLGVRRPFSGGEITGESAFRRASSALDERSDIFSITAGSRIKVLGRGELRSTLEWYDQTLTDVAGAPSYQLTGNRPGSRGAVWSASLNYGVKGGVRLNFSVNGRHSDDRTGRVTGRGEVVAAF